MNSHQGNPRLPPELEEQIFVLSHAQCMHDRTDAVNLFLVAKRVSEWLTPKHYEIIKLSFGDPTLPPNLTEAGLQRYGHHARHFFITVSGKASALLSLCPNITNLAVWAIVTKEDLDTIVKLPLTRLSIDLSDLLSLAEADLHPFYSNITHLDMSGYATWATESLLSHFTALTHVAMFKRLDESDIDGCLTYGKAVEVLVLMSRGAERDELEEGEKYDDPRVVHIMFERTYRKDWTEGAYGRMDMWVFADAVIERRRISGSIRA